MASVLTRLNVSNNVFHLALTQPELQGIDPREPNLSKELILRIGYECKVNPWYYFREVVRIPESGNTPVPFRLNRANLAMIWLFWNRYDALEEIPRQLGKTISAQAIVSQVLYIDGRNISIAMLTKDNKLRNENVVRLKDIRDSLPKYLLNKQTGDSDNKEGISYTALNNRYLTYVAQNDEAGADNLGRGMTTPVQHWDEPATFKNIHISYPVSLSTTITAAENARKNNQPCSNILTTTAGKLNTKEGRYTHNLITQSVSFTEKMYDLKNKEELEEIVVKGSSNKMVYVSFSYLQLGKTHKWLKDVVSRINATQDTIDRDYLNIWKLGSASEILSQEILTRLKTGQREPLFVEIKDGYIWRWYIDKHFVDSGEYKTIPMILGMDSSENVGRDFTSLVLLDARDMSLVATCRCNESNIIRMAIFIATFLIAYTNTLFIPERKSTGSAIIDTILIEFKKHHINPFKRIYNLVIQNRDEEPYKSISISSDVHGTMRKYFGFTTTGGEYSRHYLYSTVFSKAMELNGDKIYDSNLIEEISGLVVKNGRVDHAASGHDDTVISYLLACYVLFAGKNLEYYNIEHSKLLSHYTENRDPRDITIHKQQEIRDNIILIKKKINDTDSEILRAALYRRLKQYEATLDDTIDMTPTIAVISQDQYAKNNARMVSKHHSFNDSLAAISSI